MSKIKDYIANNNGVLVSTPEAAKEHLGDVDVIAYEGFAKDKFRSVVEEYKSPPVNTARKYKEYDLGSDIVVFSSLNNIVDLVAAPPVVDTPVGTTIDPEELVEEEVVEEVVEEDNDEPEGTSSTTWF